MPAGATAHDWVPLNDPARLLAATRDELTGVFEEVARSGWLIHGPQHAAFEAELADYLGVDHAFGVASGTDAIEIALRALAPADRPVVVTAANCGGYTTTAARRAGLTARYVDVDPLTHSITAETLAPVLDSAVGVVIVTHLYGRATDVAPIRALCEPLGIKVVEDCAQALGAGTTQGRVGSLGDAATFSFYPTKNLGALGDGGAIATRSADVAQAVHELRQYGWRGKYTIAREGGANSRLDELQAAILRTRLPQLDAWNATRCDTITGYTKVGSDRLTVLPAQWPSHVGHLAVVECDERGALVEHLTEHRIRTDVHYPVPDHRQPAFAQEYADISLPVTEALAARVLSIPVFPELTEAERERVGVALAAF